MTGCPFGYETETETSQRACLNGTACPIKTDISLRDCIETCSHNVDCGSFYHSNLEKIRTCNMYRYKQEGVENLNHVGKNSSTNFCGYKLGDSCCKKGSKIITIVRKTSGLSYLCN